MENPKLFKTEGVIYIQKIDEISRNEFHKAANFFIKAFGAKNSDYIVTIDTKIHNQGFITYNSELGYVFIGTHLQCSDFHNALCNFCFCYDLRLDNYELKLIPFHEY
jgi:hypothetical protein